MSIARQDPAERGRYLRLGIRARPNASDSGCIACQKPDRWALVLNHPCGRQHLPVSHLASLSDFDAIAADYPVFRIEPA